MFDFESDRVLGTTSATLISDDVEYIVDFWTTRRSFLLVCFTYSHPESVCLSAYEVDSALSPPRAVIHL